MLNGQQQRKIARGRRGEILTLKKIAIIPTLLTLGNGVCGFAAIVFASKIGGDNTSEADTNLFFALSGWLIVAAMLFDALDGYVARLAKSASKFGGELDSLCDAISFGVAPAFLLLRLGPGWEPRPILHQALGGIAALYMVCAVLRLARFNVDNTSEPSSHKRFRGLPSPGAAGCLASLAILRGELPAKLSQHLGDFNPEVVQRLVESWSLLGALAVALLMVSRIPYPHATKKLLGGRRHFGHLVEVVLAVFIILLARELALVLIFWIYAVGIPLRYLIVRQVRRRGTAVPSLDDIVPR
jgi:CDP-diacylglycerol--serine O-phosphatidyltransferase